MCKFILLIQNTIRKPLKTKLLKHLNQNLRIDYPFLAHQLK
jgi:hypothetical protein